MNMPRTLTMGVQRSTRRIPSAKPKGHRERKNRRFDFPKSIQIPHAKETPVFRITYFWNQMHTVPFHHRRFRPKGGVRKVDMINFSILTIRLDKYEILSPWRKGRKKPYHQMYIRCRLSDRTWVLRASNFKPLETIQCHHLFGWEVVLK